jgi:hypothetical protein
MKENKIVWSQKYISDLCDFGDPRWVIFYTEDEKLFKKFKKSPHCIRSDAYRKDGVFLGADVYFKRSYKKNLIKRLKRLGIMK